MFLNVIVMSSLLFVGAISFLMLMDVCIVWMVLYKRKASLLRECLLVFFIDLILKFFVSLRLSRTCNQFRKKDSAE